MKDYQTGFCALFPTVFGFQNHLVVDTQLYTLLARTNSEYGGVFTIEYLIPVVYTPHGVPVSQCYRSGIGEQGTGVVPPASCCLPHDTRQPVAIETGFLFCAAHHKIDSKAFSIYIGKASQHIHNAGGGRAN